MAGTEVEHASEAALQREAAAEHLAALEPRHEDHMRVTGDHKGLAVHLLVGDVEVLGYAGGDRVRGIDAPDALQFPDLPPVQFAAGAVQLAEDLGHMSRVHHQQPHAVPHALAHPRHDGVIYLVVRRVSPPEQHVRGIQHILREAVFRLLQRGGADHEIRRGQTFGKAAVDTAGIKLSDRRLLLFVNILVPDCDSDGGSCFLHDRLLSLMWSL